jgi:hypothetical protein
MRETPFFPIPFREAVVALTLIGMALIAASGARGSRALLGFGMFCLGIAALDGLHRRRFGFRQMALFLGIAAVGLGAWAALATGFLVLLELPVGPELRSLLVASASCAAGSAAAALLAVRSPAWLQGGVWDRIGGAAKRIFVRATRLGEPHPARTYDAGRPLRQAEPTQGG